ncbi:MAG TPA: AmmeMemoRadiSam system protein B [Rhodospirillaceae bacterium]|nr:AmmeMemoRadiSam system protein B [Rhodospirillaceae bacterium]
MGFVRAPAVAGMFYPAAPDELAADVGRLLGQASCPPGPPPKAVIAPHAGYVYSGPVAASVYASLRPVRHQLSRVVLMGPSHRVAFRGIATSSAEWFETPLGRIPVDHRVEACLAAIPGVGVLDAAHAQEHSLEVHLPFLQIALERFSLVPLVVGEASAETVSAVLDALWGGDETLIVISSDLSHYLDYGAARRIDDRTRLAIESCDGQAIGSDQACGRLPILGLLDLAKRRGLAVTTVDLRNSGDTAGPRDRVVGYGAWAFVAANNGNWAGHAGTLLALARQAITWRIAGRGSAPRPETLPAPLQAPAAAFVTLSLHGRLRGCIGSLSAWRPLAEEVADNAVKAALNDPRFAPVSEAELDGLEISVSVLTPAEPIAWRDEADLLGKLQPRRDGLIIDDGQHRAVFLPAVWEQLPDPHDFLAHLKQKAGLTQAPLPAGCQAFSFRAVELKQDNP